MFYMKFDCWCLVMFEYDCMIVPCLFMARLPSLGFQELGMETKHFLFKTALLTISWELVLAFLNFSFSCPGFCVSSLQISFLGSWLNLASIYDSKPRNVYVLKGSAKCVQRTWLLGFATFPKCRIYEFFINMSRRQTCCGGTQNTKNIKSMPQKRSYQLQI